MKDLPLMLRLLCATILARQHKGLLAEICYLRGEENSYYRQRRKRLPFTLDWRRRFCAGWRCRRLEASRRDRVGRRGLDDSALEPAAEQGAPGRSHYTERQTSHRREDRAAGGENGPGQSGLGTAAHCR